jgi:hypothetical protein
MKKAFAISCGCLIEEFFEGKLYFTINQPPKIISQLIIINIQNLADSMNRRNGVDELSSTE